MRDQVILVDTKDQAIGVAKKLEAHKQALLHRAFSVFVFREYEGDTQLLIQQRHADKYHCGGLWTNTCCSHPQPGEDIHLAAEARLMEELGFSTQLEHQGFFIYQATFDNGLTEHELDHVFRGWYDGKIDHYDRQEIAALRWIRLNELQEWFHDRPQELTPWFKEALTLAWNVKS